MKWNSLRKCILNEHTYNKIMAWKWSKWIIYVLTILSMAVQHIPCSVQRQNFFTKSRIVGANNSMASFLRWWLLLMRRRRRGRGGGAPKIYSWASDSCWTSLNRLGDLMDPCTINDFNWPFIAKCFRINRETRICGRICHSNITSFGVLTWNRIGNMWALVAEGVKKDSNVPDRLSIDPAVWHTQQPHEYQHDVLRPRTRCIPFRYWQHRNHSICLNNPFYLARWNRRMPHPNVLVLIANKNEKFPREWNGRR